jgi:hypothetical protein
MNFPPQALATATHNDVGKVTIPNVPGDGAFTHVQFFCRFLN